MSLFTALLRPAPVRAPGRHTDTWLKQQQANAELQAERDTAREDIEQLKQVHARERAGWQQALELAAAESRGYAAERDEARGRHNTVLGHLRAAEAEIKRLRLLLDASTGEPGSAPTVAPLDDPQSCFSQPSPPPAGDEPRIVADTPVAPASYDIADVHAETLAVDVADLRAGAEATQQLDAAALRNAAGLGATAVLPVVAVPPLPGCKPPMPGEVTLVDAVLPLRQQSVPVSLGTGQRARDSVAEAVGAP